MSARIVPFLITLLVAAPVAAGTVVVFDTAGPGGAAVLRAISDTLRRELVDHDVIHRKRPRGWKVPSVKRAAAVGRAVVAAGADVGVDSMTSGKKKKRKLTILAVSADGTVLFEKSVRLPKKKPGKKVAGLSRNIARALADQLRDIGYTGGSEEVAASETVDVDPSSGSSDIITTDSGSMSSPMAATSSTTAEIPDGVDSPFAAPKVEEEVPRSTRRGDRPFHIAVRFGGGVLSYHDNIATTIAGGELDIKLGFTMLTMAGLEAEILNLIKVAAVVRRHAAKMTHEDPTNPAVNDIVPREIDVSVLGATGLVGAAYEVGPMSLGGMVGAAYDSLNASIQTVSATDETKVALVPSWTRLLLLVGPIIHYGNLGSDGLAVQVGLMVAPWGRHAEEPVTSGASSTVYGVVGWLRLRFQLPTLLGAAGGVFVEAGGDVEWIHTQYAGNGTRKALGTTTPVQASEETRLQLSGSAAVGYVF
ncbi:MAG: hypothetical protein V3T05_02410 [Myxococcota bacterium]